MPVSPQYNSRAGGRQLLAFAQTMCRLVNTAAPLIRAAYPTRTALLAVLTAAEAVCDLLPAAQAEQAEADADALPIADYDDSVLIPGQKP